MENMVSKSLLLLIALIVTGCQPLFRTANNVKTPKYESEASIRKWLMKNNIENIQIASINPEKYFSLFPGFVNTPLLFDNNGRFLAYGFVAGKGCTAPIYDQLALLPSPFLLNNPPPSYIINESYSLPKGTDYKKLNRNELKALAQKTVDTFHLRFSHIQNELRTLNGEEIMYNLNPLQNGYILVYPFAKFMDGKSSLNEIKKYSAVIKKNNKTHIRLLLINLDKQTWWDNKWKNEIKISI